MDQVTWILCVPSFDSVFLYVQTSLFLNNMPLYSFPCLLSCASQTLSWLKDNVSMATQVCSIASFEGLEAARRCQHALEQEILTNRARIEVVKRVSQGTPTHSQFLSKHKHWMDALNENIPNILQTGVSDRPGLCFRQLTS